MADDGEADAEATWTPVSARQSSEPVLNSKCKFKSKKNTNILQCSLFFRSCRTHSLSLSFSFVIRPPVSSTIAWANRLPGTSTWTCRNSRTNNNSIERYDPADAQVDTGGHQASQSGIYFDFKGQGKEVVWRNGSRRGLVSWGTVRP